MIQRLTPDSQSCDENMKNAFIEFELIKFQVCVPDGGAGTIHQINSSSIILLR